MKAVYIYFRNILNGLTSGTERQEEVYRVFFNLFQLNRKSIYDLVSHVILMMILE